ncbi:MAG: amino acid adenylation domain-containing protein, partial [bacterium]|nr:amino acid adenylation domain-containing protein [bacterium]
IFMLTDSRTKLVLSDGSEPPELTENNKQIEIINIKKLQELRELSELGELRDPASGIRAASGIAYIIYTSGSTGTPKGVLMEHRAAVNLLSALQEKYPFGQKDTWLLKTSYMFDVSVSEIFGWFLGGGKIAILEKDAEKDPRMIVETIEKYKITHINFVPAMLNVFLDILTSRDKVKLASLKNIFSAGEALIPETVQKFRQLKTKIQLENLYGPTEAAVYATGYSMEDWDGEGAVLIGKPLQNVKLYILNKENRLQPVGIPGELCIAGTGLARGYLNRPELTAERFIKAGRQLAVAGWQKEKTKENEPEKGQPSQQNGTPHSFPNNQYPINKNRLYRTGDLARWRPDGNVEYMGRIDHQIKLRGYRIELGEIENRLLTYPGVKEAVVTVVEEKTTAAAGTGDKALAAYIVTKTTAKKENATAAPGNNSLKEYLAQELPGYMIPAYIIEIEKIPLTPGGKVDRKMLPTPDIEIKSATPYAPPTNSRQRKLLEFWTRLLAIPKETIGINDSFFELGGHSLKAIALAARIMEHFNVQLPMVKIFQNPNIRSMAQYINTATQKNYTPIPEAPEQKTYPLSAIQKRFYIVNSVEGIGTAYNLAQVFEVEGKIDTPRLQNAIHTLIRRHESLRTTYHTGGEGLVQRIWHPEEVTSPIDYEDRTKTTQTPAETARTIAAHFVVPFALNKAPLLRVKQVSYSRQKHLLIIDTHHIAADGTSLTLLIRDLLKIYEGKENQLPQLRIQYKDFTHWQQSPTGEPATRSEEYWLQLYKEHPPQLPIFTDYPRPAVQSFKGGQINLTLEEEITTKIRNLNKKTGTTLFMFLLTALNLLLYKYTGQQDIVVGTAVAGREHLELENMVGLLINALAMRNHPETHKTIAQFLEEVKKNTLKAYENQDYPFDQLLEKANIPRPLNRNPLFDVELVLLNMEQPPMETKELKLIPLDIGSEVTQVDIAFYAQETGNQIQLSLFYCTAIYKETTMERFTGYYREIINAILENITIKLETIEITFQLEETKTDAYDDIADDLDF